MLPFMKRNKEGGIASLIIKTRTPDEKPNEASADDSSNPDLTQCANDLITAVHSRNAQAVSDALKAAFDILEASPHEEASEPHSYDAQKED